MSIKERLSLAKEPIYLIDGTAYVYRAYHATRDMARSDGFPTNALFTLLRLLVRLARQEKPEYLVFFMDGKGPNFRHEMYPLYKAQRSATPEPLLAQIEPIREAVELLGFAVEVSSGCEADDRIAALAARFKKERPVVIVGADKDLRQCLDENVFMWDPQGKTDRVLTLDTFREENGFEPDHWPDFQALTGDSSDNIPGVPGVGPKTAGKLIQRFGTLEALKEGLDQLVPKERDKVEPHMDDAFLFRGLTTLRTDLEPPSTMDRFRRQPVDSQTLGDFFKAYEFHSLLRELPQITQALQTPSASPPEAAPAGAVRTHPELTTAAPVDPVPGVARKASPPEAASPQGQMQFSLFDSPAPPPEVLPAIPAAGVEDLPDPCGREVALIETTEGLRLCLEGKEWLFSGSAQELARALAGKFTGADALYCPNTKSLLARNPAFSVVPVAKWFDLGLAAYLLDPEDRDYSWERLTRRFEPEMQTGPETPGLLALEMGRMLASRLRAAHLFDLMQELEAPLAPVLATMEQRGVRIDQEAFASFLDEVRGEIEKLTHKIHQQAGGPFNVRSSRQLADLLFNTLGLKPGGKTPGGEASTSQDVLERLAGKHPVIEDILEFRKLEKLRSTYLEPFPKLVDASGRVHTTFNQLATATGRLSSSNPNLQNIPIKGQFGLRMRNCFIAGPGNLLAGGDYSQVELRVLAHMSGDPTLIGAFRQGEDIHARTAGVLFDKSSDEITPDERRSAKTVNFGLIYGMGPQKLARALRIPLKEAKEFIERYFSRLTTLRHFYEEVETGAKEQGYVTTLAGRRRLLPDIHSRNSQLQSAARRQAVNTLIQGSAADIIKLAMLEANADPVLHGYGAELILQVHDELLLEVPQDSARVAGQRLADVMSRVQPGGQPLSVPLVVDWGAGFTWAEAH
jgi:DNA polymerase I